MKVPSGKFPSIRFALVAATISAAFLLLTTAAYAQEEAVGGAVAPPASATEDAVSIEETPPPAPPVEAPAETPEPESAVEAIGAVVETANTAIESNPATSTASAASETIREATSETHHNAAGAVGEVATETAQAVGGRTEQVSGFSEEIGAKVSAVAGPGDPSRLAKLVQPTRTPSGELLFSSGGDPRPESPVSVGTAPHTHGTVQSAGVLPRVSIGGISSLPARYRGSSSLGPRPLEGLGGKIPSAPANGATDTRSNDRAPLDGPTPAPGYSGAAAGSTGTFFTPLAALLALLALAVSAVLRRFGEAPDFRPPTPFVCALERPG